MGGGDDVTTAEIRARDRLASELERDRIDRQFIRLGHRPEVRSCDHKQWQGMGKSGRYCACGTCMVDLGD